MNLKTYLKTYGITWEEFADRIGVVPSSIYNYTQGIRKPRPDIANRIVEETRNLVSYADLYAEPEDDSLKQKTPAPDAIQA